MKNLIFVSVFLFTGTFLSACEQAADSPDFLSEADNTPISLDVTDPQDSVSRAQNLNEQAVNDFFIQANEYVQEGNHEGALDLYEQALNISSEGDKIRIWGNKGATLYHLERYEEALEVYDQIIAHQPDNIDTYNNKGAALTQLGRHNEAIELYQQALALDSQNFASHYNLGCAYALLGDRDRALTYLEQAFALNPDLKNFAPKDTDLQTLWEDEAFLNLLES